MPESWRDLFSSDSFMPHGHCYLWEPGLVWLQVVSNGLIALAYIAIASTLAYLVYRVRDIPFKVMYLSFGVFIIACGVTHLFDVYVIWEPAYWADGAVRAITALASVGTAIALPPLVPKAVELARGAKAAHDHGLELETVVRDLGTLYKRTRELEQLKTEFFANVSHELRTPLALILGPTDKLLAADNLTAEQRRDLELVLRNGRTLLKHVNDLLDLARLEAGKAHADYERADVAALVRRVAAHFEGLAREHEIDLALDVPEAARAEVDSDKLERVVLNLLSNAFKFTPARGRVRVTLKREQRGMLRLEVADSGPGVRAEQRELVFERFRQLDSGSARELGGAGLGLAITKDFVELHGGSILVERAPEGGALFVVALPERAPEGSAVADERQPTAARSDALAGAVASARAEVEAQIEDVATDKPLVLVVEDNPDMNQFLREALGDRFRVAAAHDGKQGLERALELRPDLIVTDMMMPRMSGDELVGAIRERAELSEIPIVLITAKADDELRVRLLREGAQDYVMKPFSVEEVKARIENLVTLKRARDVLRRELHSQEEDLEELAREMTVQKRELSTALESVRVARESAERASRAKSAFLGMVSHELRTPIAVLKLQLERLRRGTSTELGDKQRAVVERMAVSADRLAALVESLLQYTRIESGRLTLQLDDVDLAALATEIVDELEPQAAAKELELGLTVAGELPPLCTDRELLRLIVVNLVGNAVKFTESGSIGVELRHQDGLHHIAVHDTGPGIPREARARIFEPFEQLELMERKHLPGFGLGLAIVRQMVEALGGRVELESEVGRGSTFRLALPSQTRRSLH